MQILFTSLELTGGEKRRNSSPAPSTIQIDSSNLFNVFMGCCQTGRHPDSSSTATSSHWQRKTRLEVLELPSWRSSASFRSTLCSPTLLFTPQQRHVTGGERGSFVPSKGHHFPPFWNELLWHTDPILTRPISAVSSRTVLNVFYTPIKLPQRRGNYLLSFVIDRRVEDRFNFLRRDRIEQDILSMLQDKFKISSSSDQSSEWREYFFTFATVRWRYNFLVTCSNTAFVRQFPHLLFKFIFPLIHTFLHSEIAKPWVHSGSISIIIFQPR